MPKLDLPSGAWVEYRDRLMAGDRFMVQAAAKVEVNQGDGMSRTSYLEMNNDMRNTLLGRIITGWSYPAPTPSQAGQPADLVIGNVMDLDDYSALEEAVEPLMAKIGGRREPDPKTETPPPIPQDA